MAVPRPLVPGGRNPAHRDRNRPGGRVHAGARRRGRHLDQRAGDAAQPRATGRERSGPMNLDDLLVAADAAAPVFASVEGAVRGAFLSAIAVELEAIGDDIVTTADRESHLGETRLRGELARTANQ